MTQGGGAASNELDRSSLVRFAAIRSVSRRRLAATATTAVGAVVLSVASGWPLWAVVLVGLIPVLPLFLVELSWTHHHYGWLALFYLLAVTQTGHFIEHIVQMIQIHVLDQPAKDAHGIFGRLDVEWVHVLFNTWVLLAVLVLVGRFRRNPWLWAGLLVAGWHEVEHLYIIFFYLRDGLAGNPGLLAQGGRLGGGIDVARPNLHFAYNVVETLPLYIAFAVEVRRSYDRWLAAAFPRLHAAQLNLLTNRLGTERFPAGETIIEEGDPADAMYVVTAGEVEVVRSTTGRRLATLHPGQIFGEIGTLRGVARTATVRASAPTEVICIARERAQELADSSHAGEDLRVLVRSRLEQLSAATSGEAAHAGSGPAGVGGGT